VFYGTCHKKFAVFFLLSNILVTTGKDHCCHSLFQSKLVFSLMGTLWMRFAVLRDVFALSVMFIAFFLACSIAALTFKFIYFGQGGFEK